MTQQNNHIEARECWGWSHLKFCEILLCQFALSVYIRRVGIVHAHDSSLLRVPISVDNFNMQLLDRLSVSRWIHNCRSLLILRIVDHVWCKQCLYQWSSTVIPSKIDLKKAFSENKCLRKPVINITHIYQCEQRVKTSQVHS